MVVFLSYFLRGQKVTVTQLRSRSKWDLPHDHKLANLRTSLYASISTCVITRGATFSLSFVSVFTIFFSFFAEKKLLPSC